MVRASLLGRVAIVVAYVVVFWGVLPAALLALGLAIDARSGFQRTPSAWGWLLVVGGLGFLRWATIVLPLRGRGLVVSALPPPKLVTTGPYEIVRHPIYLGYHLALIGVAAKVGLPTPNSWEICRANLPRTYVPNAARSAAAESSRTCLPRSSTPP